MEPSRLTPFTDTTIKHPNFWLWLAYAVFGLIVLAMIPGQARTILIAVILLGGGAFIVAKHGADGFANLGRELTGNNGQN